MAHITKHKSEHEGEGDNGDGGGVGLLIGGDTVCVYDLLEDPSEVSDLVVGGWLDVEVVLNNGDLGGGLVGESVSDFIFALSWRPEVSNESRTLGLHHIQTLV